MLKMWRFLADQEKGNLKIITNEALKGEFPYAMNRKFVSCFEYVISAHLY